MTRLYARLFIALLLATVTFSLRTPAIANPGDNTNTWDLVGGKPVTLLHEGSSRFDVTTLIRRFDSRGARLEYVLVPRYNPTCVQRLAVEWEFRDDVSTVQVGETLSLTACSGVGTCGHGEDAFSRCFVEALSHY